MGIAKIAVMMTVYNEDVELLEQSIGSILKQTFSDFKLYILLDNPDNKEALKYISYLATKDSRIDFRVNVQNMGLVASLNKLIGYIEEKYVARMDADDISLPERLEMELQFLQSENLDFVMSGIDFIYDNGEIGAGENIPELVLEDFAEAEKYCNLSNHPTWLMKMDVYRQLNGYRDVKYCEDFDFVLRSLQVGMRLGRMPEALLHYRLRDTGVSKTYALEQYEKSCYLRKSYKRGIDLNKVSVDVLNQRFAAYSEIQKQKFFQAKKDMDIFCSALYEKKWKKCFFCAVVGLASSSSFRKIFINGVFTKLKLAGIYRKVNREHC